MSTNISMRAMKNRLKKLEDWTAMNEIIKVKLELIAAQAKSLASDYGNSKLWEGELQRGIGDLYKTIIDVSNLVERR